ncbi:DNA-binding transcriptional regulator, MarR family [Microlunatus flavus]|uniref:DNA-binding transcriptional regulator, MarR family n=1 Tax=Microlunatus flavus TaxID=1036181 RepID=A0A1H9HA44_9ACTN|nr:DNA-binding transcriptional regulator, MarR family [Microlunatus flavus]
MRNLRSLILAGEHYRQAVSVAIGLGTTESQALSYLAVHGESGQSVLARDLGLTSSASTALVDRLERQGVCERVRHPRDRRRLIVRLTPRGQAVVDESHHWLAATLQQIDPSELEQVSHWIAFLADDLRTRTSAREAEGWRGATHALPA